MNTNQRIVLDFGQKNTPMTVWAKQGDNKSRYIEITPLNCGRDYKLENGVKAEFRVTKHDKKVVVNSATISNGIITVELTNQILAAEGEAIAEIALLKDDEILSTQTFSINVEKSAYNAEKVESSDEFKALEEKLKNINELSEAAEKINETAELVDELKTDINEKTESINNHIKNIDNDIKNLPQTVDTKIQKAVDGINIKIDELKEDIKDTADIVSIIEGRNGFESYNDILGLQIDYENKKFNRLAGAVGLNAGDDFDKFDMYGGMKRCNVSDGGTITAYYGDSNFKEDGSNGQVMVYVPKFYYKVVPIKLDQITEGTGYHIRKANYYISSAPKVGFKLHPAFVNEQGNEVEYFLYSAYEGSLYMSDAEEYYSDADYQAHTVTSADKLSSVAEKKPVTGQATANHGNGINLYRSTAETCAANRGKGWHIETIKSLSALQLLMTIEFGAMHMQEALGRGICASGNDWSLNFCADTGATSSLGNKSGEAVSTVYRYHDKSTNTIIKEEKNAVNANAVSYRGIENPYGNVFNWIQGINAYKKDSFNNGGQAYICDDYNFADDKSDENYHPVKFTLTNSELASGWISAFGYDEEYDWIFLATEVNGTTALPVGDPAYRLTSPNAYSIMTSSGGWNSGNGVGMFNNSLNMASTRIYCQVGCRLIYLPQN